MPSQVVPTVQMVRGDAVFAGMTHRRCFPKWRFLLVDSRVAPNAVDVGVTPVPPRFWCGSDGVVSQLDELNLRSTCISGAGILLTF